MILMIFVLTRTVMMWGCRSVWCIHPKDKSGTMKVPDKVINSRHDTLKNKTNSMVGITYSVDLRMC